MQTESSAEQDYDVVFARAFNRYSKALHSIASKVVSQNAEAVDRIKSIESRNALQLIARSMYDPEPFHEGTRNELLMKLKGYYNDRIRDYKQRPMFNFLTKNLPSFLDEYAHLVKEGSRNMVHNNVLEWSAHEFTLFIAKQKAVDSVCNDFLVMYRFDESPKKRTRKETFTIVQAVLLYKTLLESSHNGASQVSPTAIAEMLSKLIGETVGSIRQVAIEAERETLAISGADENKVRRAIENLELSHPVFTFMDRCKKK